MHGCRIWRLSKLPKMGFRSRWDASGKKARTCCKKYGLASESMESKYLLFCVPYLSWIPFQTWFFICVPNYHTIISHGWWLFILAFSILATSSQPAVSQSSVIPTEHPLPTLLMAMFPDHISSLQMEKRRRGREKDVTRMIC